MDYICFYWSQFTFVCFLIVLLISFLWLLLRFYFLLLVLSNIVIGLVVFFVLTLLGSLLSFLELQVYKILSNLENCNINYFSAPLPHTQTFCQASNYTSVGPLDVAL